MRIDEKATAEARARHEYGIRVLDLLFGWEECKAPLNPQTGRAITTGRGTIPDRRARRIWREWRDSTFPGRADRRRRRREQRESLRINRGGRR